MEFFKKTTQIDFLGRRKQAALLSCLLFGLSLLAIAWNGLRWGLDFTGGAQLQLAFQQTLPLNTVRQQLKQAGLTEVQVQSYGSSQIVLLTVAGISADESSQMHLRNTLHRALPDATIKSLSWVGPQAGKALLVKGVWALFLALLAIMLYVSLRFHYRLALGAAVALIHDPILIVGVFACLGIECNLVTLAAILTVIGYSLNNVIVIFDRIRENFQKLQQRDAVAIVNISINETLSRTLMTSGITLAMVIVLYGFGGVLLHGFSVALIIGILVGSYSAIYIASALAVALGLDRHHVLPTPHPVDDRP